MSDYPPEPWELRGQLHSSVYLVPFYDIPAEVPPEYLPVRFGRYAVVGIAWASYEAGGVLDYRELMSTMLVRRAWRLLPTITHIWVDSEASRDGARALWGIPKDLAEFTFARHSYAAADAEGPIATGTVRPLAWLPCRWPVALELVQWSNGAAKVTQVRARARLGIARAHLDADPSGPLAFLAGRRPLLSFSVGDFRMSIGAR
ncbi:MAG: acetoacetate decarboxylase family protein [Sciscionella sp.]